MQQLHDSVQFNSDHESHLPVVHLSLQLRFKHMLTHHNIIKSHLAQYFSGKVFFTSVTDNKRRQW